MNDRVNICCGTAQAGGATALLAVVQRLQHRADVAVAVWSHGAGQGVFGAYGVTSRPLPDLASVESPRVVLTGWLGDRATGLDYRLIRWARRQGVPSVAVLDAWMNFGTRFDSLDDVPDHLAVMDAVSAQELQDLGVPAERLVVTGHPFIQQLAIATARPQPADVQPAVLFISEPLRWAHEQGLAASSGYDEVLALQAVVDGVQAWDPRAVVRVREHPRQASALRERSWPDAVRFEAGPQPIKDLLTSADIICGMGSTLLVYAALLGRRVLCVQPGLIAAHDRNVLTRRGWWPVLQHAEQITEALAEDDDARAASVRAARRALQWHGTPATRVSGLVLELAGASACGPALLSSKGDSRT